jgi:hypothetical protein
MTSEEVLNGVAHGQRVMTTEVTATNLLLQEANGSSHLAAQDIALARFHRIHHGGSNVRLV